MFKNFKDCFSNGLTTRNQIQIYSNVLPKDFFEKAQNIVKNGKEYAASVGTADDRRIDLKIRDAYHIIDENNEDYLKIKDYMKQTMFDCLFNYLQITNYIAYVDIEKFVIDSSLNFIAYRPNSAGYLEHVDAFFRDSTLHERLFSCVYYLNDDFVGGDLYFPRLNKKIKVKKNSIVVFPSSCLFSHVGLRLGRGRKVICPAWFGYKMNKAIDFQPII